MIFETGEEKQRRFALYDRMAEDKRETEAQHHNVIEHLSDLAGWGLRSLSRWKPGVLKFIAFRKTNSAVELKIGYANERFR